MKNSEQDVQHLNDAAGPGEGPTVEAPPLSPHQEKMQQLRKDMGLLEDDDAAVATEEPEEEELEAETELDEDLDDDEELLDDEPEDELDDEELEEEETEEDEEELDENVAFISLPGRFPDDEDVEVPVDLEALRAAGLDPDQVIDRFRQQRNGYERAEQLRAQRRELREIEDAMREDPARFIGEHVGEEHYEAVAERILLRMPDEAFGKLAKKLDRFIRDPKAREKARDDAELEELREEKRNRKTPADQAVAEAREQVATGIEGVIPTEWDDDKANEFFTTAVRAVQMHLRTPAGEGFDPSDPENVVEVLRHRGVLRDFGLARKGGSRKSAKKNGTSSAADRRDPGATASRSKGKGSKADARTRMSRRKRAATSPPGAGAAAASGFQKVQGERHDSKMDRLRKYLKVPKRRGS